ncbi:hypothetical protein AVEN_27245-1 [Araneus ventricosus]|uniref:Uncharacterized protein n=1 Tax=Araneus ventricosus TaxID=182803 RepID=A0A4Y2CBN4_ARAVE|nr:hypothetical protein AVEN_27245-1 [Araneus ventricosus]
MDFTYKIAEALSVSNQSAAPTKPRSLSDNSPAVPPPKKKVKSVRSCNDVRFDGINHMIERSSKQRRQLEGCTSKDFIFFVTIVKHIYVFMLKEII